ncbi:MAG: hypothetical protein R2825_01165 [Saprospiraceae bacterium]
MKSANKQSSGLWEWKLVQVIIGLAILYFGQLFLFNDFDETTTRQAIAMSARVSVILFSLAFVASSFHYFFKNSFSWWLRMNRKYIGISFAIMHLIHLVFLIVLQQYFHPVFNIAKTISLLGGGLAYLFVVLMLLTSFPFFAKYLSPKQWSVLHTVGGYWIWYIFIRSYVRKVTFGGYDFIPIVLLLITVIIFRIIYLIKKK